MAVVKLQIDQPADGASFVSSNGDVSVSFHGAIVSAPPAPLFYHWYSSLDPNGTPISDGATDPLNFNHALGVGTHAITFAATDVPSMDVTSLQQVKHGGMTGGPKPPTPCLIDVLVGEIAAPASGANLARSAVQLVGRAPQQWGPPAPNNLQFHWFFDPLGDPPGRPSADFVPANLAFDPGNTKTPTPPTLTFSGPAPGSLALGAYRIRLRVELARNTTIFHEAHTDVTFTA